MQVIHPVTTDNWKGQINFETKCTYSEPRDRCDLISELTSWNRVLYGLNYQLADTCPGKLSIRYVPYSAAHERRDAAGPEAAFLISWLIENHRCIDELSVSCTVRSEDATAGQAPAIIRLCPPPGKGIRRLNVDVCDPFPSNRSSFICLLEENTEALRGIEELRIRCCDARIEPGLVRLLRNNANSLRHVEVVERVLSPRMVDALLCLDKCESLAVFVCLDHFSRVPWDTDTTARLLRSLPRVNQLRLLPFTSPALCVSAISDVVNSNLNLTALEIHMYGIESSAQEFFAALEVNATVRKLLVALDSFDASCGQFLASALSKNATLLELHLNGDVTEDCMKSVAGALSQNTSLETLHFSYVSSVNGVLALCDALRTNTTLKLLAFPVFRASQVQREALAKSLAQCSGYSRVLLGTLTEPDLPPLSTCLVSPTSCPQMVGRIDIRNASDVNLKLLMDALASSTTRVQKLGFIIDEIPQSKTAALCKALGANRSIIGLAIDMKSGHKHLLRELVKVFEANRRISQLEISIDELDVEAASVFAHFFAVNRTITSFGIIITGPNYYSSHERFEKTVSRGMVKNPVVVEFQAGRYHGAEFPSYKISEALRRNWSTLNRAVDFVLLSAAKDRRCAEAFELFAGKPCLLDQVKNTSGQSELNARQAIASAATFLRENYLVITGVVQSSVLCHPLAGCTQCDELNGDCWRAILRYLKVSDVL